MLGDVALATGPQGKPAVAAGGPHFSVAHSGDLVVVAIGGAREVGVDVERVRPVRNLEGLAARVLSEAAREELRRAPAERRDEIFLRHWTCAEAVGKGEGGGLADRDAAGWSVETLDLPEGYVGAVAWRSTTASIAQSAAVAPR